MLFSKTINTKKADPFRELRAALDLAVSAALKAGVVPEAISSELSVHVVRLERQELARQERLRGTPKQYDPVTYKEIDVNAQIAEAETIRAERARRESAEEHRGAVERRAAKESFLR